MTEASLSRFYNHSKGNFAILTSYRAENNNHQNVQSYRKLQNDLRDLGLGFVIIIGKWQECQDPMVPYTQCPDDMLKEVREPSLFVPGLSYRDAVRLMNKYGQDGVVYGGPEFDQVVLLLRGAEPAKLDQFSPRKIAQAYSTWRGKNFVFETIMARNWVNALLEQTKRKNG